MTECTEVVTAPYMLGDKEFPGLAKVIEEAGELGEVFGKIMSCGGLRFNPWGGADLGAKLDEEAADLLAALTFMVAYCPHIDSDIVAKRMARKYKLFEEWAAGRTDTRYDEIIL